MSSALGNMMQDYLNDMGGDLSGVLDWLGFIEQYKRNESGTVTFTIVDEGTYTVADRGQALAIIAMYYQLKKNEKHFNA